MKAETTTIETTECAAQSQNTGILSAWKSQSNPSYSMPRHREQQHLGELGDRLNDVLDITCQSKCKIDQQVTRADQLKIKVDIIKQGLTDLTKIMKSAIMALLDKKNK
ncbi:unnamed protein product [Rotaria sp. Silwood2]|nr:unnamed protein product [Rotaria sp. Silwood2]CAF3524361.1 unnamed protein product [Rotaria sp. Silwood2]CAF4527337.1 unnamed protein product [Rotaria sp. Silwood2]CAF4750898.1 unnamed protein product [Rotaria sp. Silwood2]